MCCELVNKSVFLFVNNSFILHESYHLNDKKMEQAGRLSLLLFEREYPSSWK